MLMECSFSTYQLLTADLLKLDFNELKVGPPSDSESIRSRVLRCGILYDISIYTCGHGFQDYGGVRSESGVEVERDFYSALPLGYYFLSRLRALRSAQAKLDSTSGTHH